MRDLVLTGDKIPESYTQEDATKGDYADVVAGTIAGQVVDMTNTATFSAVKLGFIDNSSDAIKTDLIDNGPKNEVYLWPGESLVFALTEGQRAQLGFKALDKNVDYQINTDRKQTLNASTDMYYNVVVGAKNKVTIKNASGDILSVRAEALRHRRCVCSCSPAR